MRRPTRYTPPDWADTPDEFDAWATDVDRWQDEEADRRVEAADTETVDPVAGGERG